MTAFSSGILSALLGFVLIMDIIAALFLVLVIIVHFRKGRK